MTLLYSRVALSFFYTNDGANTLHSIHQRDPIGSHLYRFPQLKFDLGSKRPETSVAGVAMAIEKKYLKAMTTWEYRIIYKDRISELQTELNSLGKEGWEAVSMERSAYNNSATALVKRPLKS